MGLDSFWCDANGKEAKIEGHFDICGGMLSGHGNSSFRGKRYSEFVEETTGVSLYQEEIPAQTIKDMAEKLQQLSWVEKQQFLLKYDFSDKELSDFIQMFSEHSQQDHQLKGWW
jgi:hypothetical protein